MIGGPLEDYVSKQIKSRQHILYRGLDDNASVARLMYNNNRNSWIKMASSVDIDPEEGLFRLNNFNTNQDDFFNSGLASNFVLFNGTSYLEEGALKQRSGIITTDDELSKSNYGLGGSEQGIQPQPGIENINVKTLNRGSIRKATITMKAYNKKQFELIEILYLRLGFHMMLEWGWDSFINEDGEIEKIEETLIDVDWFERNNKSFIDVIEKIDRYKEKYQANYNGFIGRVVNFDWEFTESGIYNITLEMLSLGSVVESLKINTTALNFRSNFSKENTLDNENPVFSKGGTIIHLYLNQIINNLNTTAQNTPDFIDLLSGKDERVNGSGNINIRNGDITKRGDTVTERIFPGLNSEHRYLIRFGKLVDYINYNIITLSDDTPLCEIDNNGFILTKYYYQQISIDPTKAFIKPHIRFEKDNITESDFSGLNKDSFNKLFPDIMEDYVVDVDDQGGKGDLNNLYVNIDLVYKLLDQNVDSNNNLTIFAFFKGLCDNINSALGGVNNIEPIITKDYILTFIDQTSKTLSNNDITEEIVPIEVYGFNRATQQGSFVKNVNFKTNITPDLITTISIGAASNSIRTSDIDATSFSKFNQGLIDRYNITTTSPTPLLNPFDDDKTQGDNLRNIFNNHKRTEGIRFTSRLEIATRETTNIGALVNYFTGNEYFSKFYKIPYNGKNYFVNTSGEFISKIKRDNRNKKEIDELNEKNKYALYLIRGFGGKIDVSNISQINNVSNKRNSKYNVSPYSNNVGSLKYYDFNADFINQGISLYKGFIQNRNSENYKRNGSVNNGLGFIPLSVNLTLDGISGIRIYNKLNLNQNFLPSQYNESLEFVIVGMSEDVGDNKWNTVLSTISTSNTNGNKKVIKNIKVDTPKATPRFNPFIVNAPDKTITSGIPIHNDKSRTKLIYVPEETVKTHFYMHHTAGNQGVRGDIKTWQMASFPLSTHYYIEQNGLTEYIFDTKFWSNHLGVSSLHKNSISVELTNIGGLNFIDGKVWRDYTGKNSPRSASRPVNENLNAINYKGFDYFESYTPNQIESLRLLIIELKSKHPTINWKYDYNLLFSKQDINKVRATPGVYTHNSVKFKTKTDIFPQLELIEMLKTVLN
jgi:hypothetical protein